MKSIVGRFLEHARIVAFANGKAMPSPQARVFISSADWMPRNLDRRVESLVPVENPTTQQQVLAQIMVANLNDQAQSWNMDGQGRYRRAADWDKPKAFSAHQYFMTNPSLSGRGQKVKDPAARVRACRRRRLDPRATRLRHRHRLQFGPPGHLSAGRPRDLDRLQS